MNEQSQILNKTISWKHRVFPSNWELATFSHIIKEARLGGNYKNSDDVTPTPVLKMGNIERGVISVEKLQYLSEDEVYSEEDVLKNGDLLFNTRNTLELVGKVAVWREEISFAVYNSNLLRLKFDHHFVFSNFFMNYLFNSHYVLSQLKGFATGTTSVAAIYSRDLNKLKLPLPPLPEQQKIAEILSTWDDAITLTKSTIEELKLRNKGLAQQLLTGKKRLKGFSEDWKEIKAAKIFKNHTDKTHNGELEVLSATQENGVIPRSMNNIDIKFDASSLNTYKKVEKGNFVISLRSFQGGIEYSDYEGIVSPAYTVLKEIRPISKTFYKIFLKTETFINRLNTIIYGIRDGKQIGFKDFSNLKLPYPPLEEQEAIAEILEVGNSELNILQQKLAFLLQQKKGLMNKLLTGEVRVKID